MIKIKLYIPNKLVFSKRFTTFLHLKITLSIYRVRRKFGINHIDLRMLGVARPALDYIYGVYTKNISK